ncbi:hypothetical protein LZ31DRAFT_317934 [Colletotrichum somersetense]|nr:hypothetical protein LZ31DRAFT_317934 [Colletotrichum somersetense]
MIRRKKMKKINHTHLATSLNLQAIHAVGGQGKQRQRGDIMMIQAQGIKPAGAEFYGIFYIIAVSFFSLLLFSLTEGRRAYVRNGSHKGNCVVHDGQPISISSPRLGSALDRLSTYLTNVRSCLVRRVETDRARSARSSQLHDLVASKLVFESLSLSVAIPASRTVSQNQRISIINRRLSAP